jgi:hypothetical protein
LVKEKAKETMTEHKCPTAAGALKILGEVWRNMPDSQKQKYVKLSEADKVRQQNQMKELDDNGYFTLDDGTLSSSLKPKVKRILGKRSAPGAASQVLASQLN